MIKILCGILLFTATSGWSSNAIVTENQLPGASDWHWTGTISDNCELFTDNVSYLPGNTVGFKSQTSAAGTLDIYRVGWYAGLGARKITTLSVPAHMQPAFGFTQSTFTADAGNWSVVVSWVVPSNAVSGYYLASLKVGSMQFVYPFIVRRSGSSDILMQSSSTTWNAYTGWGGYNLYGASGGSAGSQRAYAVSFNRPLSAQYGWGLYAGPQDSWDSAEMAMIHFLERNGYDVAYQSGVDTDRIGVPACKIFMDAGHDEYWSYNQRVNVFGAIYHGVNACFFSGNECFWEVRYSPDYRLMTCYKTGFQGSTILDPVSWTGVWRDPRSGVHPENALTGQLFLCDDSPHPDQIVIPASMASNTFWRHTTIQSGGGGKLVAGLLNYETDEPYNNGYEPNVTLLSQTSYTSNTYLGGVYPAVYPDGTGTMTHEFTMFTYMGHGKVFGAGTVFYSFALDSNHDYDPNYPTPVAVDPNLQQATVNLLGDMGAVAGSLVDGIYP